MAHARVKLIVGAAMVLPALAVLALAGLRDARLYYLEVDRFLTEGRFHDSRVRLCGTVARKGFQRDEAALTTRFMLLGRRQRVPVIYRGALPDRFQPGADAVVQGRLAAGGVFRASRIMTRCASKYRPDDYPSAPEESP